MLSTPNPQSTKRATAQKLRLIVASCALMIFSAYALRPEANLAELNLGAGTFLVGLLLLWLSRPCAPHSAHDINAQPDEKINWKFIVAGCVTLLFLTQINTVPGMLRTGVTTHVQFVLLCAGIISLAWGLSGWHPSASHINRHEAVKVLTLTALAFALRVWALGDAVSIPLTDEYTFAQKAMGLHIDNRFPLLQPFDAGYTFPWVYPYLISASLSLFGSSVASLRLPSAIFGALTVPALYMLGKNLFDRRIGLLAALFLATFPPHIHLSRIAINNIADPFFGVLALAFIARGMKSQRRADFALGGIALGLTQYFYEGGRLVFIPLVLVWLITNIFPRRKFRLTRLTAASLGTLALALPIYLALSAIGYSRTARLDMVAPDEARFPTIAAQTVGRNILSASYAERLMGVLLFFVHTPDNSPDFYGGYQPMILTPVVPLFLLGLGYMCLNWRHPGMRLLILWLAGVVLGLGLIRIGAWTARYVPVFPVIALLIALALYYVIGLLVAERYRFRTAVALALIIGVGQVVYYFGPHLQAFNRQIRYYRDYVDAYHRATAYPLDTTVIFISDDHVHEPYIDILKDLWERDMPVMHYYYLDFTYRVLRNLSHHVNYVFFVQREDAMTPALLRLEFHLEGPYFSPYHDLPADMQYALYYAPMMYCR